MNFLEKLTALRLKTPIPALFYLNTENSPYSTYSAYLKNSYLAFGCGDAEDILYGTYVFGGQSNIDCHFVIGCELCYFCVDCVKCYNGSHLQDCRDCTDCMLCFDCVGCSHCFGCVGLRRKEYHIFNKPYSKEDYVARIEQIREDFHDHEKRAQLKSEFGNLKQTYPRLYVRQLNSEHCIGDYIFNSKNCFYCFDAHDAEDCFYCERPMKGCKDLVDCSNCFDHSENCYEVMSGVKLANSNFCYFCWHSTDLEYCEFVFNSHDCFGCVGLNHKAYYILNEAFTKEEYFKKKAEIIKALKKDALYGKPLESTFPLDDTVVSDYFHSYG